MSKCIVCGNSNLKEIINFSKYPLCIGVLPRQLLGKVGSFPLQIGKCSKCNHIQQMKILSDRYKSIIYKNEYSELLSGVPTPSLTGIGKTVAKISFDFFNSCNLPKGKVLDIGCYDGYFLSLIKKKGYEVQGIEPNKASNIARNKYKIPITQDFFSGKYFKENMFDIIILRNILEHLPKVNDFLADINKVLKPGGYVFIEVPNTPFLFRKRWTQIFFHQHLSYFSLNVLLYLLSKHSLKLVRAKQRHSIYLLVKKIKNNTKIKYKKQKADLEIKKWFSTYKNRIKKLNEILKNKDRVAIFGAGGDTIDLIHMQDKNFRKKIQYVYDNNKFKHGNFLAELPVMVQSPNNIKKDKAEVVIVSTSLYQTVIVKQLKTMNIPDLKIVALYPKVRFV